MGNGIKMSINNYDNKNTILFKIYKIVKIRIQVNLE